MLKYITTYIPCYIWNENKFYEWMQKTIDSLKQFPYFNKMKLFICQNDKEESLRRRCNEIDLKNFDIIYLKWEPIFLPIRVFDYMQNDKETKESDYIFYLEWDHILHIEDNFINKIFNELDKWNIVMPHRLWKIKFLKNVEYEVYKWFYVWNYFKSWIEEYDNNFERMLKYNIENKVHNDYAWCYFTKKLTIQKIHQRLSHLNLFNIYIWYFHFYWLLNHFWLPYTMKLEFPSLILTLWWIVVLKSKDIWNCYVEHLSQNWYV